MHGMEYAFAQLLMAYGSLDRGVKVTQAVRDRYDGAKRNPWNEIECGSNYARSMASWGAVVILAGFEADLVAGRLTFRPTLRDGDHSRAFWSGPPAYGTFAMGTGCMAIEVLGGTMEICRLDVPVDSIGAADVRVDGRSIPFESIAGEIVFEPITVAVGTRIEIQGPGISLDALIEVASLGGGDRAMEAMVATT